MLNNNKGLCFIDKFLDISLQPYPSFQSKHQDKRTNRRAEDHIFQMCPFLAEVRRTQVKLFVAAARNAWQIEVSLAY